MATLMSSPSSILTLTSLSRKSLPSSSYTRLRYTIETSILDLDSIIIFFFTYITP